MGQKETSTLKQKTVNSVFSLFFQSGYAALLGLVANFILTVRLDPRIFGIYITVLSVISFLNYFSDIGLAASLIQKKEIDEDDRKTVFTIQQILIISLIALGFASSPIIQKFFNLPKEGLWLFWALLVGFYISSLKTIPSINLERKIQFKTIVLVQIIESTFFYISIIIGVLLKLDLMSFIIAVLVRAFIGLIAMYYFSPWIPGISISTKKLRVLTTFGFSFQSASLLALFKDDLITLFLSKALGFTAMGYIGWAKKWAEAPIRIIMDNLSRVLFPVLSRIQHEKERVTQVIEKMLHYQTLVLAPTIVGMALVMERFVLLVPKYQKWESALPMFYLFCLSAFFSSYSTPFINLFNALGKASVSLIFMVVWTTLTWILTPTMIFFFDRLGFPIVQVMLSLTFFAVLYYAKKFAHFSFLKTVAPFIFSTFLMGLVVFLIFALSAKTLYFLLLGVFVGTLTYVATLKFVFNINIIKEITVLFKHD